MQLLDKASSFFELNWPMPMQSEGSDVYWYKAFNCFA